MATDVNNKGQAQAQQPAAGAQAQGQGPDKNITLQGEDLAQKEAFLKAHGWRKLGVGAFARWKDPTKPLIDTYSKPGEGRKVYVINPESGEREQVMAQIGKGEKVKKPVEQVIMTPAGKLMPLDEAVTEQCMRDYHQEIVQQEEIQKKEHEEARKKAGKNAQAA